MTLKIKELDVVMTQQEVADLLKINIRTWKKWRATKPDMPEGISMGSNVIFRTDEVLDWLEKQRIKKEEA